jgi:hypothetical protein
LSRDFADESARRRKRSGSSMKCVDRRIGKHLAEYAERKLTGVLRHKFETHILECQYCWQKTQEAEENEQTDALIREYGKDALLAAQRNLQEEKHPAKLPLALLRGNELVDQVDIELVDYMARDFFWTKKLSDSGVYAFRDREEYIPWRKDVIVPQQETPSFPGRLSAPSLPIIEIIRVAAEKGAEPIELIVSLEYKEDYAILSLAAKRR